MTIRDSFNQCTSAFKRDSVALKGFAILVIDFYHAALLELKHIHSLIHTLYAKKCQIYAKIICSIFFIKF